jgi:hypothetical protein
MKRRVTRRIVTGAAVAVLAAGSTLLAVSPAQAAAANYICSSVNASGTSVGGSGCTGNGTGGGFIRSDAGVAYVCGDISYLGGGSVSGSSCRLE